MKFKAAIFDMDGTLIDSTWVWKTVFMDFCKMFNLAEFYECFDKTIHMTPYQGAEFMKNHCKNKLDKNVEEVVQIWFNMAKNYYINDVKLKPGAERLLKLLTLNNIPICLATSCYTELCDLILKKLNIFDYFSHILLSEQLNVSKKTADIYLAASKKININPVNCAVFEDIIEPLNAVKKCNMGYFAIDDQIQKQDIKQKLKRHATTYINDFNEFIDSKKVNLFFDLRI